MDAARPSGRQTLPRTAQTVTAPDQELRLVLLGVRGAGWARPTLHRLWSDQPGLTEVPVDASFLSLGGHSLTGVELVNRIRQALGVEVQVADLFRAPTIRAMAGHLTTTGTTAAIDIGNGSDAAALAPADTAPATSFQRRGWRVHHANPHPEVYNVAHRIRIDGDLDPAALRRALGGLVDRHTALRTRLVLRDGELVQEILADLPVRLPVTDLSAEPDGGSGWGRAAAVLRVRVPRDVVG
ncbi:phosphopantetheine-binding protein [Micromonospora sp. WMMD1102]|uniref:phosphopantetheine-binding protein n=1 Tax=Micromonospora sp. WMMD1102 TaxID=3016105 RepID=UPI0024157A23|nr:phosphopantetheine-binding protein [Micromonospora sp. WMMD1102]MDG4789829.1 phosphopantetheine-binding protein [Micromonospora sp. WMMD1102]